MADPELQPASESLESSPAVRPVVTCHAQQDSLRSQVKDVLGPMQMKACGTLRLSYTLRDTVFIYLLLIAAIGGVCVAHRLWGPSALLTTPLFAILTGIAFNWINVQIHEASHNLLLKRKSANDAYCNLVLGALALQDVQTYRATHRMHHAYLHTEADPDRWVYTSNVGSFRNLAGGILEDLTLRTILARKQQVSRLVPATATARPTAPRYTGLAKLCAQGLVLGLFVAACGVWGLAYYVSVYLYGLLAVFPVLVRVRTVVQHYDSSLLVPLTERSSIPFVSRSTVAPIGEFILVGARMDYHFEHHIYPNLPYYGLKRMHQTLQAANFFESVQAQFGQALHTDNYLQAYLRLSLKA